MNNRRLATVAGIGIIAVAVPLILFIIYPSREPANLDMASENTSNNSNTFMIQNFTLPSYVPTDNSSSAVEDLRELQKIVCGEVGREDWLPERVNFNYLQSEEIVWRIPCTLGPAGYMYHTFYFSQIGEPTIIDDYNPNKQLLFTIDSAEEAAEYVIYFDVKRAGTPVEVITIEDKYNEWVYECVNDNLAPEDWTPPDKVSPVKGVTAYKDNEGQGFTVELNYVGYINGTFEYAKYHVIKDGTIELIQHKSLGECGFAI